MRRLAAVACLLALAACDERLAGRGRALEGDTIEVAGREVRLRGVRTPREGMCFRQDARMVDCGERVRHALADLLSGSEVACEGWRPKGQRHIVGRCALAATGTDVATWLVLRGYAVATDPNLEPYERVARHAGMGIWAPRTLTAEAGR